MTNTCACYRVIKTKGVCCDKDPNLIEDLAKDISLHSRQSQNRWRGIRRIHQRLLQPARPRRSSEWVTHTTQCVRIDAETFDRQPRESTRAENSLVDPIRNGLTQHHARGGTKNAAGSASDKCARSRNVISDKCVRYRTGCTSAITIPRNRDSRIVSAGRGRKLRSFSHCTGSSR